MLHAAHCTFAAWHRCSLTGAAHQQGRRQQAECQLVADPPGVLGACGLVPVRQQLHIDSNCVQVTPNAGGSVGECAYTKKTAEDANPPARRSTDRVGYADMGTGLCRPPFATCTVVGVRSHLNNSKAKPQGRASRDDIGPTLMSVQESLIKHEGWLDYRLGQSGCSHHLSLQILAERCTNVQKSASSERAPKLKLHYPRSCLLIQSPMQVASGIRPSGVCWRLDGWQ